MSAKPKDYDRINIYSTEDMRQLDNRFHSAPRLYHMQFSPSDDLLAYSTFQNENNAASVSIISLPKKKHARGSQVLGFDISTAHLYWQSEGKFLAIKMGHQISKKNTRISHHSIGIIAVKKQDMPYTKSTMDLGKFSNFLFITILWFVLPIIRMVLTFTFCLLVMFVVLFVCWLELNILHGNQIHHDLQYYMEQKIKYM